MKDIRGLPEKGARRGDHGRPRHGEEPALADRLIGDLRAYGLKVGVVAIDPTSPVTAAGARLCPGSTSAARLVP